MGELLVVLLPLKHFLRFYMIVVRLQTFYHTDSQISSIVKLLYEQLHL